MSDHLRIDQRSLAFGRAIAARVAEHPELIERARETIRRWLGTCSPRVRPSLEEWLAVLDGPLDGTLQLLTGTDDRARRLRQSSPFVDVLTPAERNEIILQYAQHDPASA